jgi:putative ABC transport system permease protein
MNMLQNLMLEVKLGGRILMRSRWQSAVIVLILALSISALTSVASVVSAVVLKPYGPIETDRWVYLWEHPVNSARRISVSTPNFLDWKRQSSTVFSHVVLWLPWSYTASGADAIVPQQIRAAVISPEVFEATGTVPAAGRLLIPADSDSSDHMAVLSYEFWQRAYGGRASLIGSKINLNLVPHTVVGIAPPGFCFPPETQTDAWTPIPAELISSGSRSSRGFRVAAQLRPGVSAQAAQSAMTLISRRLAQQYPEDKDYDAQVVAMREAVAGDFRTPLVALSGALAFALLLACLNIGYLRAVHLGSRRKEILLRLAIGANRVQLVRQFLVETMLLFGAGGLLGLAISPIATRAMISLVPAGEIPWLHIRTDFATSLAVFAASLLCGLAAGLLPAVRASRIDPARSLGWSGAVTNTSTMGRRMRNAALAAQIALALVPLCGAGLLIRSFQHLQDVAPGFDPEQRLTLMFPVPRSRYAGIPDIAALARRIGQETSQAPGVRRSAVVQALPFAPGARWLQAVTRSDPKAIADLGRLPMVRYTVVTAGYFESMGIPLKAGRTLNDSDDLAAQPVVVINQQLARAQFSGEDPVGKRIWVGHAEELPGSRPRVIVGVVGDTKMDSLETRADPAAWVPIAQQGDSDSIFRNLYLVAQTSVPPASALSAIRERIRGIDADLALSSVASMQDRLGDSLWRQRFSALVVGAFSFAALAIAVLGVFGMTSYVVACRTFEIGVRIAVGATPSNVLRMILGQSISVALLGIALGLLGCAAITRVLATFLFGIRPDDPLTFGGVALLLLAAAAAASYLPSRRAATVDPIVALKME